MNWTAEQLEAIRTTGGDLLVSAAAGSGKTAVLAARCAYLVCDAPEPDRCDVDELVVLTFTDAAAAEMRQRIVRALRERSELEPSGTARQRLLQQVHLVDAARISTIHSFCLWTVRRWFNEAGIDPQATVLQEQEALLLQREVLDRLLADLYAAAPAAGGVLGEEALVQPDPCRTSDTLAARFVRLVDDYGLGEDRDLRRFVLRVADFLGSLPQPEAWLRETVRRAREATAADVLEALRPLGAELLRQAEYAEGIGSELASLHPTTVVIGAAAEAHAQRLRAWAAALERVYPLRDASLSAFEALRADIATYVLSKPRAPRKPDPPDAAFEAAHERARDRWDGVAKHFKSRVLEAYALFTIDEWIAGLAATAAYVETIIDLVRAFRSAYAEEKRRLDVLDFADFERKAYELLCTDGDPARPSDAARMLQARFRYVLVDEAQDINPLQEAIIRLVSRGGTQPGNLFVVGDVKQSIYRFRLAEPNLFLQRMERLRQAGPHGGRAIFLQKNFRSRPEVLDAVNVVFRVLMQPDLGELVYDAAAELRLGRDVPDVRRQPVELHVLERQVADNGDAEEPARSYQQNPALWDLMQREGYAIGRRIQELMAEAAGALRYRDIVVLLRAARVNGESITATLTNLGIPAYCEAGGSLLAAREVRDVVAGLNVLDNPRQDIPLAAVLRNGLFGERLTEDEMVEVRCHVRDVPFHECVLRFAARSAGNELSARLGRILQTVDRFRGIARRRPVSELLQQLYDESGLLGYVAGLPNGPQRRANLLKLLDLARQFGSFRKQGLHRFLRFLTLLDEQDEAMSAAPAVGAADDVVRVMTIHQSKGLQFPVVFLAGLGGRFNLRDRAGRMIFERRSGIGLRVVDPERMIEYPSLAHRLVSDEVERTTREEEARILYVAMTRAQDRLILIGTSDRAEDFAGMVRAGHRPGRRDSLTLATARNHLDWLEGVLSSAPIGAVAPHGRHAVGTIFAVRVYDGTEMSDWSLSRSADPGRQALLSAVARGEPLPADEPRAPDDAEVQQVLTRINYVYPHLAASSVRAVLGASELKRPLDHASDPDVRATDPFGPGRPARRSRAAGVRETVAGVADGIQKSPRSQVVTHGPAAESARLRGLATHKVLQHIDFRLAAVPADVAGALSRLQDAGLLSKDELEAVDADGVAWFLGTELARRIRAAGDRYRRELKYVARESPELVDPTAGPLPGDSVLVRGIVDGVLVGDADLEIIDFKTDTVPAEALPERVEQYHTQVTLYGSAMSRLFGRPVRATWLVFLAAHEVVQVG